MCYLDMYTVYLPFFINNNKLSESQKGKAGFELEGFIAKLYYMVA